MRPLTEPEYDADVEILHRTTDMRRAREMLKGVLWAEPVLVDGAILYGNVPLASEATGVPQVTILKAMLGRIGYLHPRGRSFEHYPREYPTF